MTPQGAPAIEDLEHLLVPVICIYEVFERILQLRGLDTAGERIADLYKGSPIDLTPSLALSAARISVVMKLAMSDSIILAMARSENATLWTQDEHFKGLPKVKYIAS